MGAAFDRLRAALEKCSRDLRQVGDKLVVSCPGPGHWRGDTVPSLVVTDAADRVLLHCHAGCNSSDILTVLGLEWGDLFNEARRAGPSYVKLRAAIGKARGLRAADRYLALWLLGMADWRTCEIPPQFQPKGQRALAEACGLDRVTVQTTTAHLVLHGWLSLACMAKDCKQDGSHRGRGHRPAYSFPGIGDDCPGEKCRMRCAPRKAARRSHLHVVSEEQSA